MAFAVGAEIGNLEGGVLTPNQALRSDIKGSLTAGKVVFCNQQSTEVLITND